MSRKADRKHLFNLIFQTPYNGDMPPGLALARYIEHSTKDDMTAIDMNYIESSYFGVVSRLNEIDALIDAAATGWDIGRLSCADLAVLRICVYECVYRADVATQVAINEAIELAKLFGEADSPKFINGVMGKIAEDLGEGRVAAKAGT